VKTYQDIENDLQFSQSLSVTPNWSAAADFLDVIKQHCLRVKPQIIVECSSGVTTLVLARCCQLNGQGKVYSLENDKQFAEKSRQQISELGLDDYAQVIYAPLQPTSVANQIFDWYGTNALPEESIDMLVIDGPPGFIQKNSRMPALPVLRNKLSEAVTVFLDDAARADERELVGNWLTQYPEFAYLYIANARGCVVLKAGV